MIAGLSTTMVSVIAAVFAAMILLVMTCCYLREGFFGAASSRPSSVDEENSAPGSNNNSSSSGAARGGDKHSRRRSTSYDQDAEFATASAASRFEENPLGNSAQRRKSLTSQQQLPPRHKSKRVPQLPLDSPAMLARTPRTPTYHSNFVEKQALSHARTRTRRHDQPTAAAAGRNKQRGLSEDMIMLAQVEVELKEFNAANNHVNKSNDSSNNRRRSLTLDNNGIASSPSKPRLPRPGQPSSSVTDAVKKQPSALKAAIAVDDFGYGDRKMQEKIKCRSIFNITHLQKLL